MPATIRYKSGYPSTSRAFDTSANIASDGLVTGTASFLVPDPTYREFSVNSPFKKTLISSLAEAELSGLFVESRSTEKRGGLWILRVNVVGAVNPPVVERKTDVSPRSLQKSEQFVEQANPNAQGEEVVRTFSFDYSSQTTSASTVITDGEAFGFEATTPIVVNVWNRTGRGFISKTGITGEEAAPPQGVVVVYPRILLSETREMRAGIVRINKTAQFIYE